MEIESVLSYRLLRWDKRVTKQTQNSLLHKAISTNMLTWF